MKFKDPEKIRDFILEAEKKGKIALMTFEGLATGDLRNTVYDQPVDGLLYDLNRDQVTVLTNLEESTKWVNDYAVSQVITLLRDDYDQQKEWIAVLEQFIRNGYELGYIDVPDENDPAYYTLQQLGCVP